ncbi:MAG: glycosyltransferase [Rhodospirillales bacterium]|nr:MAG: glycosyltransferase [Rhodospirillales bacterium]
MSSMAHSPTPPVPAPVRCEATSRTVLVVARGLQVRFDGDYLRFINIFPLLSARHRLILFYLDESTDENFLKTVSPYFSSVHVIDYHPKNSTIARLIDAFVLAPEHSIVRHDPHLFSEISCRIRDVIEREHVDLIHAWGRHEYQFLTAASVPTLYDLCDALSIQAQQQTSTPFSLRHRLRCLRLKRHEAHIVKRHTTVFVSDVDADFFVERHDCHTIPNGVDIHYFTPNACEGLSSSIIFSGVMNFYPNVDAVLYFATNVFPLVKSRMPSAAWYIVGRDPTPEIQALHAPPDIIVTGFVDDLREHVGRAQVVICPMISGSGIKNKVLEAMALGRAVVSTPSGVAGIDFTDGTHLWVAESAESFAARVVQLLGDSAARERIGQAARRLVEARYSWQSTVDRYDTLYRHLTNTKSVPAINGANRGPTQNKC